MLRRVSGITSFPDAIQVLPECLGMTITGTFDSCTIEVVLPVVNPENHYKLISPLAMEDRLQPEIDAYQWSSGAVYQRGEPDEPPIAWYVKSFAFRAEVDSDDQLYELAHPFGRRLAAWVGVAVEWLALWTGQALDESNRLRPEIPQGSIWVPGTSNLSGGGSAMGAIHVGGKSAGVSHINAAFFQSSRGIAPPESWRVFMRAERWGNDRLRVIDLTTAAEMAIEGRIDQALTDRSKLGPEARQALMAATPGIVEKLKVLEALMPPETSRARKISFQIAQPRNRAVHGGEIPKPEDVANATKASREILELYAPLPQPEDIVGSNGG